MSHFVPGGTTLPPSFLHRNPPSTLVYGNGALAKLALNLAELGVLRPVLVAGRRTAASRVYRDTLAGLQGLEWVECTGMPEHSPLSEVLRLREMARTHRADGFIAVGGGSASDACKAAALWLAEGGELADHATRFIPPDQLHSPRLKASKLPVIAIPTTLSGAEVTAGGSVRTEDGRKLILVDPQLAARLIVIDPAASMDVPASVFLASGMNGLAHCVEGFYSRVRTPVSSALALEAIRMFMQALPAVAREPDSVQARGIALVAAHLSGQVLLNARSCIHHSVCHALGAVAGISHGDANSIMLPHAMAFNSVDPDAAAALALCARAMGASDASPEGAIERVQWLQQAIKVPTRLRDTGMQRSLLTEVAAKVMGEKGLYVNPRRVTQAAQVEPLLLAAW
jgi:alcohol dehydrogenase